MEEKTGRKWSLKKIFLLCLSGVMILIVLIIYWQVYPIMVGTIIVVRNPDNSAIRFRAIYIDGNKIAGETTIAGRGAISLSSTVYPRKELLLSITPQANEPINAETKSCRLDNNRRPCAFEVYYRKDKLVCSDCERL